MITVCATSVRWATEFRCSITHSHAMNVDNAKIVAVTLWWQVALYSLIGVLAVATAGCAFMMIRSGKKNA